MPSLVESKKESIQSVRLERPASVRNYLPHVADRWILDSYVIGPENAVLNYLFLAETIQQLHSISPVFFYGEKGVGKTALAITLAVRWSRSTRQRPVAVFSGKDFCQSYASSIEIDDLAAFRAKTRQSKLLLIDDFDAFSDKTAAQVELADTIENLIARGHAVILTSNALPLASSGFSPRLISRISGGFSVPIIEPGDGTRAVLVDQLIQKTNPKLPSADLMRLVDDLCRDRPLTLPRLANVISLANQNAQPNGHLDLFFVRTLAQQTLMNHSPDVTLIAKSVCRRMNVSLRELRGVSRSAKIVRARGLAILLTRKFTTLSLHQIGKYFGGRDHSTILNALRRMQLLLEDDPVLNHFRTDVESELLRL